MSCIHHTWHFNTMPSVSARGCVNRQKRRKGCLVCLESCHACPSRKLTSISRPWGSRRSISWCLKEPPEDSQKPPMCHGNASHASRSQHNISWCLREPLEDSQKPLVNVTASYMPKKVDAGSHDSLENLQETHGRLRFVVKASCVLQEANKLSRNALRNLQRIHENLWLVVEESSVSCKSHIP